VGNIGSVESLALLDECFRPEHLFARAQANGHIEHRIARRVLEPLVINRRHAVA
jgi:hypothetical protein